MKRQKGGSLGTGQACFLNTGREGEQKKEVEAFFFFFPLEEEKPVSAFQQTEQQ